MPHIGEKADWPALAGAVQTLTATGSPHTFTATQPGAFVVNGGTVTLIEHIRGGATVAVGLLGGTFPAVRGDALRITYAVVPTTILFIPQ